MGAPPPPAQHQAGPALPPLSGRMLGPVPGAGDQGLLSPPLHGSRGAGTQGTALPLCWLSLGQGVVLESGPCPAFQPRAPLPEPVTTAEPPPPSPPHSIALDVTC